MEDEEEREYDSGPYCRHWGTPGECDECAEEMRIQKPLADWMEQNNQGGFKDDCPPPEDLIRSAFPLLDDDEVAYLLKKPSRIYERFTE